MRQPFFDKSVASASAVQGGAGRARGAVPVAVIAVLGYGHRVACLARRVRKWPRSRDALRLRCLAGFTRAGGLRGSRAAAPLKHPAAASPAAAAARLKHNLNTRAPDRDLVGPASDTKIERWRHYTACPARAGDPTTMLSM